MLMVPKATERQLDGFRRLLRDNLMLMVPKATEGQLMLMVPKATEGQFDVNGSEGY